MPEEKVICSGLLERIGLEMGNFVFKKDGKKYEHETPLKDHEVAVKLLVESLIEHDCVKSLDEIKGVGHRVLHGGEKYADSVIITEEVIKVVESCNDLAPLHNPANLIGIAACKEVMPEVFNDVPYDEDFPKEDYAKINLIDAE